MNKKPLKIYIAGPYTDKIDTKKIKNTVDAIDAAIKIFLKGHFPYIPHLTHFVDKRAKHIGVILKRNDYMKWHDVWISDCDALLHLRSSKGSNLELKRAKKLGKKIFYSIDEIATIK